MIVNLCTTMFKSGHRVHETRTAPYVDHLNHELTRGKSNASTIILI